MKSYKKSPWHNLPESEITEFLETNIESGILTEDAVVRLKRYGLNEIAAKKGKSAIVRFFLNFNQPLVYILLIATGLTAFLREWVDSSVIFGVVMVNAVIGFLQESKALKAIEALAKIMQVDGRVIRNGRTREIPSRNLVPGDIVLIRSGDKVPADLRLIHIHDLYIDESNLTGESVSVEKRIDLLPENTSLADRTNMAFASTLVTHGQAKGIVIATGNETQIGQVSQLISEVKVVETPLTIKIKKFSNVLLVAILAMAGLTFAIGMFQGYSVKENFFATVSLAVAAIPEGLPATFTIILAISVSRMAKRNAIIRKLTAVETLGSTTVICSDKTGTLTQNQMTVQEIFTGGKHYKLTGRGYSPEGKLLDFDTGEPIESSSALRECLLSGLLCNDSVLVEEDGRWFIEGDPTEGALIVAARKIGLTEEHYFEAMPRVACIPFESEYQYMASMHDSLIDGNKKIYIKGAAETILEKCDTMMDYMGQEIPIERERILEKISLMAKQGMRVLAFSRTHIPMDTTEITHETFSSGLTFLGIQGMMDPPRAEVIDAIKACYAAGIQVKMITGDHTDTALAIAKQLNIKIDTDMGFVNGRQLEGMSQQDLIKTINQASVFARVTPQQKLVIVNSLQLQKHVVAMTGDGVNDAPALRQADIGVSMGKCGTEVAKEASDMILTDDNFVTIKAAVEEGRCVFDNLTKFIIWTLPTNLGEAMIVIVSIFFGTLLPLLPVQILWINMMTALFLGLTLAFEKQEKDIMSRLPRDPDQHIITKPLIFRIILVSVVMTVGAFYFFKWEQLHGGEINVARTVVANIVVMCEIFYLLNCRSLKKSMFSIGVFSNPLLVFGVIGMILAQVAFTYLPIFNTLFSTSPLPLISWGHIILVGLLMYGLVGLDKWIQSKFMTS